MRSLVTAAATLVVTCAGCGGSSSTGSATTTHASSQPPPASTTTTAPACPNPEGALCLGELEAGTYTTRVFNPTLTYTVPAGWFNYEDTPGNFLLVPPYGNLPGVNAGTSDYIGVYTAVAAEAFTCSGNDVQLNAGFTPVKIARYLRTRKGVISTAPRPVSIGGLQGVVIDLRLAHGAGLLCPGYPLRYIPIIIGVTPTGLDHGLIPHLALRLYLLMYKRGTLCIEVDDLTNGRHLERYDRLVRRMRFG
jgi:hypothetical protein